MKSALRYFALFIVVAGCTAAAIGPKTAQLVPGQLAATAKFPMPKPPAAAKFPMPKPPLAR